MGQYPAPVENDTPSLFDLLKGYKPPKKGTERGELLEYFAKEIGRPVKYIGVRLAHYSVDQLYGLKSAYNDRLIRPCGECLRQGVVATCTHARTTAAKYWWWITKVVKEGEVV